MGTATLASKRPLRIRCDTWSVWVTYFLDVTTTTDLAEDLNMMENVIVVIHSTLFRLLIDQFFS
ncbi:hypothetical protein [Rhodococcus pyridinivorans]|uniref:hypothetical protein n=1 Tax=Rhodococcus pyridinivorans TaxID=103816 RepID=UPI00110E68D1|nr:hypothetical protein [Rhodococcus pyridinivorans]